MKILQICSARDIGGGERHVCDLSNALAARGHDVFVVAIPRAPLIAGLTVGPTMNVIETRTRGARALSAAAEISAIVRAKKIAVIHAHAARDYPLAAMVSAGTGVPFVLTRHVLFPMRRVNKLLLRKASRVIAVSKAVASVLRNQRILAPEKIVTIHNGIALDRFAAADNRARRPAALDAIDAPLIVGSVGHIAPIKGSDHFVRAAAMIIAKREDVVFLMVGEDKSANGENRAAVERLVRELGVERQVHLLGWQDNIGAILPHLDVFVSCARSEPFGLAIVEAMAAGSPVVATATDGATEIIDHGTTGRLVPVGDVGALAAEINDLLTNAAERKRLSSNAQRAARERFSLDRMVDAVEHIYNDVAGAD